MLNELNFEITAEGVENEYLFFCVNHMPCDLIQGYFVSKPIDYKAFVNFVQNFKPDEAFVEFRNNDKRMRNMQMVRSKFYIYKYYKKLKEIIRNKPTNQQLNDLSGMIELDHKNCDFGKWYYSVYPIYNQTESFKRLEALHIDIHKTTEQLLFEKDSQKVQELINSLKYKVILLDSQLEEFYLKTFKY
jgi:hypothetical protein